MNLIDKKFTSKDLAARNRFYEQQKLIGYWAKKKGISLSTIEQHPQFQDVVLLLNFRDALWQDLNKSEQGIWAAYWNLTYCKNRALSKKKLNKLEQITNTVIGKKEQQAQQREKVKALRTQWNSKSGGYMMANAPDSATVPISSR
jgi:hypothetical protein